eukprot:TRINITY_DN2809_c0_g1_i1.p1 TRINITY_DN2809_c0_g1~~TRINITY_DN2809_c0_g1_i1.p1  ORF type:complete len:798 (+),score=276.59 TRINITY_DN2809_c0_g1_i1:255-2396(+)
MSLDASRLDVFGKRTKKKDADIEHQARRQPSTTGWGAEAATKSQRLPIKNRQGALVPNQHFIHEDAVAAAAAQTTRDGEEENGADGTGSEAAEASGGSGGSDSDDMSVYDSADDQEDIEDAGDVTLQSQQQGLTGLDLAMLRKRRYAQKKAEIAQLCEAILENPEDAVVRHKVKEKEKSAAADTAAAAAGGKAAVARSRLEQLHALAYEDEDLLVQQLAMLSEYAVFKDIIPAYRIRMLSDKEKDVRVSKDVQRVRDHERGLLSAYQTFLKYLESVVRSATTGEHAGGSKIARAVAVNAVHCMCGLLTTHPHFNFRANLILAIVPRMDHAWPEVSQACYDCVVNVFKTDQQGEVALEVTRAVAKFAKDRKYTMHERVLRCLCALPLRVREDEAGDVRAAAKSRRRKRKAHDVEAELMEAEAKVNASERGRCHADALKEVTLMYFRVLKNHRHPALLPAVMEGLAKFAHLINLDTVEDLLALLKGLLREEKLTFEASLHCVLMAFRTLQGPGRELQVDDKEFVVRLYALLPRLSDAANRAYVALATECVDTVLVKRREHSPARVAAFLKRILGLALHFPSGEAKALVGVAHALALRYGPARQMLENEQDRAAAGAYSALVEDPDHANPFATSCWELSLLKFSYHPDVAKAASDMGKLATLEAADAVAAAYMRQARESTAGASYIFSGVKVPPMSVLTKADSGSRLVFPHETVAE